ncbi:RecA-like DNA recombinase [Gordonia phage KidneyBean]|uniref:RecA-like DNA recombinase n=1 Tax=Gordonia phage KidneyBean TaxID=2301603 RepID=A0A385UG43_9CAUD|nr:Sak4-like ssDNA annealing protein [Gordonia phage KidneyBean]AYB69783.1 RecA-like DNA recombinase [Gordonia phage KidneyBean]AYD84179.1 RecA-like DNA recombinase [Gordonia phage Jifall16]
MSTDIEFDLPDDIVDIDEYTENITMLVYGDPGIGKTRFAGTGGRVLFLATENGTISARKSVGGEGSKVWDCTASWQRFKDAYEWLRDHAGAEGFPFDWVCVDTGTQLQLNIRRDIVDERVEEGTAKDLDPDKVHLDEYGKEQQRLMRYVTLINDLPVNVCWTAHAMLVDNEEGKQLRMPQFHGQGYKVANWIAAQMHCVGYMHKASVTSAKTQKTTSERVIQWHSPDGSVIAKDRFDALGPRSIRPNLAKIAAKIEEANSIEDDEPATAGSAK